MNALKNMKKTTRSNLITYGIVVVFYIVVQALTVGGVLNNSMKGMLVPICTYVVLAISLNLTVGILGELSLGHAGFMSVGAFSGAVFWVVTGSEMPSVLGFALSMLIGGVVAGVFGFLIGIPVLRLRGDYLAIVTLAFGEIIKNVLNTVYLGLDSNGFHFSIKDSASMGLAPDGDVIINGAIGISGMKKASTFLAGVILILITLFVILNLINSRAGRAIMSIRDNRIAAEATGINVTKYKLMAFIISAVFAGMAGVLYALNFSALAAKKFAGAGVRGAGRHRQYPRLHDRGHRALRSAGAAARRGGLPHAGVRYRADRDDDLQPEPPDRGLARADGRQDRCKPEIPKTGGPLPKERPAGQERGGVRHGTA